MFTDKKFTLRGLSDAEMTGLLRRQKKMPVNKAIWSHVGSIRLANLFYPVYRIGISVNKWASSANFVAMDNNGQVCKSVEITCLKSQLLALCKLGQVYAQADPNGPQRSQKPDFFAILGRTCAQALAKAKLKQQRIEEANACRDGVQRFRTSWDWAY